MSARPHSDSSRISLPAGARAEFERAVAAWESHDDTRRLFARDATLWTASDEANWLGWLDLPRALLDDPSPLLAARAIAREGELADIVVLGMGGSSLAPEVWRETFGVLPGFPALSVLDSTDPAQVRAVGERIDPRRTLFVVASKSGSTLEPNLFEAYFFDVARRAAGDAEAGRRFVAITDPGSDLERLAREKGYRQVFAGVESVGGRYSALSNFGMVPAALMGLDVARLLEEADRMRAACAPGVPAAENPGVMLGTVLGAGVRVGIDKLTIVASPGLRDLGAWLEQLVAESTGKQGRGIIPVDRERLGSPESYGGDRLFVYVRLEDAADEAQDAGIDALERAGRPVVRIRVPDRYALAAEMYRWEIATAVAGSLLGIHPFDQPDVEASKVETRALTEAYEQSGALAPETPFFEGDGLRLFADPANAAALRHAGPQASLAGLLRAHLDRLRAGDYFALLAYVAMTETHEAVLQTLRHRVRDARRVATCLGFGPRFLHSTGQTYKGGPNTGVFLQITAGHAADVSVPGRRLTFGAVQAAQARGDFAVLASRGRRALRVHLGADVPAGLRALDDSLRAALLS
jgi:transaldolase/glucose-6-phosphate isomerase